VKLSLNQTAEKAQPISFALAKSSPEPEFSTEHQSVNSQTSLKKAAPEPYLTKYRLNKPSMELPPQAPQSANNRPKIPFLLLIRKRLIVHQPDTHISVSKQNPISQ
jgi:hypothetical protein